MSAVYAFATSSHGLTNDRGRVQEDRWAGGQNWHGAYVVVADGITHGRDSHNAATVAVTTVIGALVATDLQESAVFNAVLLAHRAVAPWYADGSAGGTTLAVATLTAERIVAASVGDSVVLTDDDTGHLRQVNPQPEPGPLTEWIGQQGPIQPWLDSWPVSGPRTIAATSDGIDATGLLVAGMEPAAVIAAVLARRQGWTGDDACITVGRSFDTKWWR